MAERRVTCLAQFARQIDDGLPFGFEKTLRIAEACEGAGLPRQLGGIETAAQEESRLARRPQLAQADRAELRTMRRQPGQRRRIEETAHLLAERLVLGLVEPGPDRLARQSDFERLPGALVGLLEGGRQARALI